MNVSLTIYWLIENEFRGGIIFYGASNYIENIYPIANDNNEGG